MGCIESKEFFQIFLKDNRLINKTQGVKYHHSKKKALIRSSYTVSQNQVIHIVHYNCSLYSEQQQPQPTLNRCVCVCVYIYPTLNRCVCIYIYHFQMRTPSFFIMSIQFKKINFQYTIKSCDLIILKINFIKPHDSTEHPYK